jgi:ABC-2 type transport system permease protein
MTYTLFRLNLNALLAGVFIRGTKKKAVLLAYIAAMLMLSAGMMFNSLIGPFFAAGIGWMYFALIGSMIFALGVLETVFVAGAQIFKAKDNDSLLAMPVKPRAILLSRLLVMLAFEDLTALLVFVPAAFLWLRKGYGSIGGLLWLIAGFAFLPLLSSAAALLLAWLLAVIGGKMRGKNIVTMVLSVGFLFLCIYGYMNIQKYLGELVSKGEELARAYQKAMPPFYAFGASVAEANAAQGFIFAAWSIAPFAMVLALLSSRYLKILTASSAYGKTRYNEKTLHSSNVTLALVKKELAHCFSRPAVMLNSSLGSIFAAVGAAAVLVKREVVLSYAEPLRAFAPSLTLPIIAALAVMLVGAANNLSSSLVSLEGKQLWITKSSPITAKTILLAKAYAHIVVSNIPCLLAAAVAASALGGGALGTAAVLVLPQTFLLLTAFGGVAINLHFPRLDWLNEVQVVKQSVSAVVSMFGAPVLLAGLGLLYYFALKDIVSAGAFVWLCAAVFAAASCGVYHYLCTGGANRFEKL